MLKTLQFKTGGFFFSGCCDSGSAGYFDCSDSVGYSDCSDFVGFCSGYSLSIPPFYFCGFPP